jgi:c-di-GMP-binding flagellar brake protein YcgR
MANRGREIRPGFGIARFEERKYPRLLLDLPIEYYPAKSKIGGIGHTANASEGGLIIYLRKHFKVGQLMKMKVFFSSGPSLNSIEILSRVVWTEKLETGEYRCGIKFIDISQEDMSKLSSFLKDHSDLSH